MVSAFARNRTFWQGASLAAILLLGLALRLAPWGQNRFLEDEALYAYWGLQIATGADPLLDAEPVDKPPLHAYTLALSFLLFGQNETAARLPSLLASVASIALVYALGRNLPLTPTAAQSPLSPRGRGGGGEGEGLLAALLLALSPFDILFASTAFTDPLLSAWVLAALLAAARGRLGAAGVLAGLAVATKQQGLFFLPLVVALGVLGTADARNERTRDWRTWARFAAGLGVIVASVVGWDLARAQHPGFWEQGFVSYGGLGPAQPESLGQRAVEWLRLVGYFWASPWLNGLFIGALALWAGLGQAGRVGMPGLQKTDGLMLLFVAGFLLLHWLVGFQVWDRYLLALVPLLALLAGRALVDLTGCATRNLAGLSRVGLGLVLMLTLSKPLLQATRSELPVGGDHGAYDGIDELAGYMRSQAPPGSVLYHHWLGYHYRFYLYGAPLRLHWYPDLDDLARDATVYRREPRYIAFPSFRDGAPAQAALAQAGISLVPAFETTRRDGTVSFRLYRLEGP